jgi:hypothetical protein
MRLRSAAMQPSLAKATTRVVASVLIFVAGCLLSSARIIWDAPISRIHWRDEVSQRSDARFAALKALLPERGVVGYVGDSADPTADYYLTQYALAPLVVEHSLSHPLIVGNFRDKEANFADQNLRVIRDFGDGVLLLAPKEEK